MSNRMQRRVKREVAVMKRIMLPLILVVLVVLACLCGINRWTANERERMVILYAD